VLTANITKIGSQELLDQAKIAGKIPELVHGVIRQKTIERHAQQAGIVPTPEELQAAADRFRVMNKLESAEATWQWLQTHHLSVDDFEKLIAQNLIAEQLAQHLFGSQVEQFFHQNLLDYTGATIYEVVLEDREVAMEIFYSLQEGDLNFAEVAYQYIPDPELRRRGGYLGTVGRKQMRPEISAAVFGAKAPQLIKPIVTAVGIHLIYVEEIVEPQLTADLRQRIVGDMFNHWLQQQIAALTSQVKVTI
jgi:parvulin-like peptidyl-prolyl isomerase